MKHEDGQQKPRFVFRYLASHWVDTLRDGEFKIAQPTKFNDPFDCVGAMTGSLSEKGSHDYLEHLLEMKKEFRTPIESSPSKKEKFLRDIATGYAEVGTKMFQRRKSADEFYRILCCAKDEGAATVKSSEMLMWAHYTNGHRGVRIGLDLSKIAEHEAIYQTVEYSEDLPVFDLSKKGKVPDSTDQDYLFFFLRMIFTKNSSWGYEKEVRLVTIPEKCREARGRFFWKFKPGFITRVDFGALTTKKAVGGCMEILNEPRYNHVEIRKQIRRPGEYAVDYEIIRPAVSP